MHKVSSIALIAFGIFSGQALADEYGPGWGLRHGYGPGMMMERIGAIDTNDDGVISDDEAAHQVELVFASMDADDDGELTEDEYMSVRMGPGRGLQ